MLKWPKSLHKLHVPPHILKGIAFGEIYPAIVLPEAPTFLATHRRLLHRKGQVRGTSYRDLTVSFVSFLPPNKYLT